jgi:hypothetical protein
MLSNKIILLVSLFLVTDGLVYGQPEKALQGLIYKSGTSLKLGNVQFRNKRNLSSAKSNIYGMFHIAASAGDTLEISCPGYNNNEFIVTDFTDRIFFLKPATALPEVRIIESSIQADLNEVKRGYRKKSVFYTGTPHYYYLVLKPMTFIYENFKSEVKNARKFNRYAIKEMAYYEIAGRFNDLTIKNTIPIKDDELDDFRSDYWPAIEQLRNWTDYDLSVYIMKSYQDFKKDRMSDQLPGLITPL